MNTMLLIIAIFVSIAILSVILALVVNSKYPHTNLILLGITLSIPMYFIYRNLLEIEFYKTIFIIIMTTIFFYAIFILFFSFPELLEWIGNKNIKFKNRKNIGR